MEVKILAFGIARDIFDGSEITVTTAPETTVGLLLEQLKDRYPPLRKLSSLAIAVNTEYAEPEQLIHVGDEVVIIPPVAGG